MIGEEPRMHDVLGGKNKYCAAIHKIPIYVKSDHYGVSFSEMYDSGKVKVCWYFNQMGRCRHIRMNSLNDRREEDMWVDLLHINEPRKTEGCGHYFGWDFAVLTKSRDSFVEEKRIGCADLWHIAQGNYEEIPNFITRVNEGIRYLEQTRQYQKIVGMGHRIARGIETQIQQGDFSDSEPRFNNQKNISEINQDEHKIIQRTANMFASLRECPGGMRMTYHICVPRTLLV